MYYGVAYYPEQKTPDDLKKDIRLLIESGINTVRMGEFAWCRFEPQEGEYHFEWLDPVVEELGKAGIYTVICTPTSCPPAWMCEKYPEILYVDNRGVTRPFGGRRHYCYTNEKYRELSRIIAEKIGEHYGQNPYVLGFQIDNEPAQEATGTMPLSGLSTGVSEMDRIPVSYGGGVESADGQRVLVAGTFQFLSGVYAGDDNRAPRD